ncbi:winged helix-turn-helix transcriptional regulator [Roseivirga pacifica]|uniref:winged helix-turn-helix transcriptional regulator n=1 Tax=Roseivirga pacifica TaxID=1267423 RepID=UPI0020955AF8|nr:helix-turn-helix domain-containing protein [Roseivirga pacifica]MCO6360360.1 transcriptional regulator [Roseivirga pacifica]MCO6368249.1 transcriptional regulator [Roseivirga pacifica]MCO6372391.1 transcriptional regulator [Roseivirga pacifica]MCO6376449.1 transcriptional regulator [Roseivirga pacifica]MCO6378271.1 transcriptional regulator [Roseivirga pacifica]
MEKVEHNAAACQAKLSDMEDALYVIGGKWKLRIIIALKEGPMRFNQLQRTVSGISAKVLSNELKDLEENGFVVRKVYTDTPVVIEYEPTPYCDSLQEVLISLQRWGRQHREKLQAEF